MKLPGKLVLPSICTLLALLVLPSCTQSAVDKIQGTWSENERQDRKVVFDLKAGKITLLYSGKIKECKVVIKKSTANMVDVKGEKNRDSDCPPGLIITLLSANTIKLTADGKNFAAYNKVK